MEWMCGNVLSGKRKMAEFKHHHRPLNSLSPLKTLQLFTSCTKVNAESRGLNVDSEVIHNSTHNVMITDRRGENGSSCSNNDFHCLACIGI